MKSSLFHKRSFLVISKCLFWFSLGAFLGLFFFVSFTFIIFQKLNTNRIFPGIFVDNVPFGRKTQDDVQKYFAKKNEMLAKHEFVFTLDGENMSTTAKDLDLGYNDILLAQQAFSIGRSSDIFSNVSLILQAYISGINLSPSYRYSEKALQEVLLPFSQKVYKEPVNALFEFSKGKVTAFKPSSDGYELDNRRVEEDINNKIHLMVAVKKPDVFTIPVFTKTIKPSVTTDKANNLGIKEEIGMGTSLFQGSILNRIHNVTQATSRMHGTLVAPNEEFSFNKVLGDVSVFTGYKQAYIIENGKTVLGDGGGVCQVSTTLFRAVLAAGLSITQRHAHAYRVHYYEEDSPPGIDATVYSPSVDFRFKNDTGNYILIQSEIDPNIERLTFTLYGTKDGRISTISKPVIVSQTPAPEPAYQDDPTLPQGVIKQIDFAAPGASVYFTRQVIKNGKTIISEKFVSNYTPWKAVYLKGTKE